MLWWVQINEIRSCYESNRGAIPVAFRLKDKDQSLPKKSRNSIPSWLLVSEVTTNIWVRKPRKKTKHLSCASLLLRLQCLQMDGDAIANTAELQRQKTSCENNLQNRSVSSLRQISWDPSFAPATPLWSLSPTSCRNAARMLSLSWQVLLTKKKYN